MAQANQLPGVMLDSTVVEKTWAEFDVDGIAREKQIDRLLAIIEEIVTRLASSR